MLNTGLQEKIEKELKTLGDTPDIIAQSLKNLGIKGWRGRSNECPIAVFLAKYVSIAATVNNNTIQAGGVHIFLPYPVAKFIRQFDNNQYPEINVRLM